MVEDGWSLRQLLNLPVAKIAGDAINAEPVRRLHGPPRHALQLWHRIATESQFVPESQARVVA